MARSIERWRGRWLEIVGGRAANDCRALHADEEGKLSLLTAISVAALVVAIGFIGDVGNAVKEKIELQNAADSVAYSNALWQARGMNAVTLTNHLLGEVTALAVLHEALGGPQVDAGMEPIPVNESRQLNEAAGILKELAPIGKNTPGTYGETGFTNTDQTLIDQVMDRMDDDGEHAAGAAILDSKLVLKRRFVTALTAKSIANIGFYVPPPWGYASAAAAYATHLHESFTIGRILQEWIVLEALESFATNGAVVAMKQRLEGQLIPALISHADQVAGVAGQSRVSAAAVKTVADLGDSHRVTAALFPAPADLRLPVVREPSPSSGGGGNAAEWGGELPAFSPGGGPGGLSGEADKYIGPITERIKQLESELDDLDEEHEEIEEELEKDGLSDARRAELEAQRDENRAQHGEKQRQANKVADGLAQFQGSAAAVTGQVQQALQGLGGGSGNPSVKHLPPEMNQQTERYSQWTRATYPYADVYRAPVLGNFSNILPISKAADHYEKWSNRYTLVKSWQFRSGRRFQRSGSWSRSAQPLAMLVMNGTYERGGQIPAKGRERWARDGEAGKREAERLFTVIGFAHRNPESPAILSGLFKNPNRHGSAAYSQAILYNANPQQPDDNSPPTQADVGWDTLNWHPETEAAPEWGAPASNSGSKWPWQIFSSTETKGSIRVKLHWEAKLMPVTQSRLTASLSDLPGEMRQAIEPATRHFDGVVTH